MQDERSREWVSRKLRLVAGDVRREHSCGSLTLDMAGSRIHEAYFFQTDDALIQRLTRVVCESLTDNRFAMLFLTREHNEALVTALRACGIDVENAVRESRLRLLDARALRDRLLDGSVINQQRFDEAFDKLLSEGISSGKEITVCGEIVNLLWHEGHREAALQLEKLWDDVLRRHHLHIFCTYESPGAESDTTAFKAVSQYHASQSA